MALQDQLQGLLQFLQQQATQPTYQAQGTPGVGAFGMQGAALGERSGTAGFDEAMQQLGGQLWDQARSLTSQNAPSAGIGAMVGQATASEQAPAGMKNLADQFTEEAGPAIGTILQAVNNALGEGAISVGGVMDNRALLKERKATNTEIPDIDVSGAAAPEREYPRKQAENPGANVAAEETTEQTNQSGLTPFQRAFKKARAEGKLQFSFNGEQYTTRYKEETEDQWMRNLGLPVGVQSDNLELR